MGRAEQLVDVGLPVADVDAPGRVAQLLRGPGQVVQPADALLLLDRDAGGVDAPLEGVGPLELLAGQELDGRQARRDAGRRGAGGKKRDEATDLRSEARGHSLVGRALAQKGTCRCPPLTEQPLGATTSDEVVARYIKPAVSTGLDQRRPLTPLFAESLRHRRCLVLADGFYGWQRQGRRKRPFCFRPWDDKPFAFAGLWDVWGSPPGVLATFCILTTEPNELVRPVHNRTPGIVAQRHYDLWLSREVREPDEPAQLCAPTRRTRCTPSPWGRRSTTRRTTGRSAWRRCPAAGADQVKRSPGGAARRSLSLTPLTG